MTETEKRCDCGHFESAHRGGRGECLAKDGHGIACYCPWVDTHEWDKFAGEQP
ncbi:hypothetical protein [Nocardia sp. NPDC046763]|uniref:hypothetical protein n=1 Tax=Nocardia sp. NPDC046763 TaxID=3155256 RepID=UPI00340F461C